VTFRYHPSAEEELLESIRYYENKAEDLGAEFLSEVEKTLTLIQSFPDLGTLLTETDRRMLLDRFSYGIRFFGG
jgi:plasmid stabilization system protein ParE